MILPAAYIPSAFAIDKLPSSWDKRVVIICGMILCAVSLFLVGPTTLIDLGSDNMLYIMIAGQALLGLCIPISLILALPSMVESVINVYPTQIGRVNNLSSGIFCAMSGIGEVIGPLFGAAMYEKSGFRMTSDMTAMATFFYCFIFIFIITNGVDSVTSALQSRKRLQAEEESKEEDSGEDRKKTKGGKSKKLFNGKKVIDDDTVSFSSESLLSQSDKMSASFGRSSRQMHGSSGDVGYSASETLSAVINKNKGLIKRTKEAASSNSDNSTSCSRTVNIDEKFSSHDRDSKQAKKIKK